MKLGDNRMSDVQGSCRPPREGNQKARKMFLALSFHTSIIMAFKATRILLQHLTVLKTIAPLNIQKLNPRLTKPNNKILHDFSSTQFWLQGIECKRTQGLNIICADIYIISLYVNKSA